MPLGNYLIIIATSTKKNPKIKKRVTLLIDLNLFQVQNKDITPKDAFIVVFNPSTSGVLVDF